MNPLNLSPAALAFWGDIIRRILTLLAASLVTHGFVTQGAATAYEEELVGVILGLAVTVWGHRATYWAQIRAIVSRTLSPATHETVAQKVSDLTTAKALPSVFTPADVIPTLVKP